MIRNKTDMVITFAVRGRAETGLLKYYEQPVLCAAALLCR